MATVKVPFVRSAYNYDVNKASDESGIDTGEGLTKQSFAEECDINTIVKRFGLTGQLPSDVRAPRHGDFTGVTDFREAMETVRLAREAFDEMPAQVRSRFNNDPAEFVDFCSDERNLDEMRKLGLVVVESASGVVPDKGEQNESRSQQGRAEGSSGGAGTAGGDSRAAGKA